MDSWSGPRPLPEGWSDPTIGFDAHGRATAAYAQLISASPVATRVAIADAQSGDEWVDGFETLSTAGDIPIAVSLAVGADGSAAACFTSWSSTDSQTAQVRHRAVYRPAGTDTWEDPFEVVGPSGTSPRTSVRDVQVAANGVAVVLVDRHDGPDFNNRLSSIVVSSHSPNGTWTPPQQVNQPGTHAEWALLGLDGSGNATIAWLHRWQKQPDMFSVRVVIRNAATQAMSQPAILTAEQGTATTSAMRLAVNGSGAAVLGTQIGAQLNMTTRATPDVNWQPMTAVFTNATASSSNAGAVAVSPTGTSYALWWRQGPTFATNNVIGAARHPTGAAWEAPVSVSVANMELFDGAIVFRGDDAFLIYAGAIGFAPGAGDPGVGVFQTSRWNAGSAQQHQPPVDLAPQGARHFLKQAVWDNAGSIVVTETGSAPATPRSLVTTLDQVLTVKFSFVALGAVKAAAFSPDGGKLAVAGGKSARVFDLSTGQRIGEITHTAAVNAVTFRPDGLSIATASDDNTARLTKVSGEQLALITHGAAVTALAVSSDGTRLASASVDGIVQVLTVGSGSPPQSLPHDDSVVAVTFSPDSSRLATACADGAARIFNTAAGGEPLLTFGQGGSVNAVAFNHDGTRLATGGDDHSARIYDTASGAEKFRLDHDGPVAAVAFDADGSRLGTASADGTCRVVNVATGTTSLTLAHPLSVTAIAFSADGNHIATTTTENIAYLYDKTGTQLARLRHGKPINAVAFRPGGTQLATACDDKSARIYAIDNA